MIQENKEIKQNTKKKALLEMMEMKIEIDMRQKNKVIGSEKKTKEIKTKIPKVMFEVQIYKMKIKIKKLNMPKKHKRIQNKQMIQMLKTQKLMKKLKKRFKKFKQLQQLKLSHQQVKIKDPLQINRHKIQKK